MALPTIGHMAPTFTLPDQNGTPVKLREFRDRSRVVLFFYPKAMTPGCTVQACGIRDIQADLAALDTIAFGISPDPVPRLQRFIEKQQLNFSLLSDEDHAVAEKYGVWGLKKFMGREFMGLLRTTFIVGKDGRLLHIMDKVRTKTHHDDLLAWLREHDAS